MEKEFKTIGIVDNLNNERVATLKENKSLSDKINQYRDEELNNTVYLEFLYIKHVKEFIKQLKEETENYNIEAFKTVIDKLAGKELI